MTDPRVPNRVGISRRELLRRGAAAGLGLTSAGLLAACGDSGGNAAAGGSTSQASSSAAASKELSGTIVFLNYPAWIGPKEIADFTRKNPGVQIKQNTSALTESVSGTAVKIAQNPKAFDMLLADASIVGQLQAGGFVAQPDFEHIPNIKGVAGQFRKAYPMGIPTDYGKVGFGYRKDIVKERPKSWADFWDLAPRYSKKIVVYSLDRDVLGAALRYLGLSVNTKDHGELDKARDAVIAIKPHIKAFKPVDVAKELVTGGAALALAIDYDVALAQTQNKNIEWVSPTEGMPAYLEGWIGVKQSDHLPIVTAFSNFHLEPRNYASFVNTTGTAYTMPGVRKLYNSTIAGNPILGTADLDKVEFEQYVGPDTTKYTAQLWNQVESA